MKGVFRIEERLSAAIDVSSRGGLSLGGREIRPPRIPSPFEVLTRAGMSELFLKRLAREKFDREKSEEKRDSLPSPTGKKRRCGGTVVNEDRMKQVAARSEPP